MINEFLDKLNSGALLTAVKENGEINTMTVSWGGVGILWGKQVAFIFVRPQRYTFSFTEEECKMSLSFFNEDKKDILTFCGTKSGRDIDKITECGLKYTLENGYPVFEEAIYTLKLSKIYSDTIKKDCFIDTDSLKWYKSNDFHTMYICEIRE